jgi:hypothetical protein
MSNVRGTLSFWLIFFSAFAALLWLFKNLGDLRTFQDILAASAHLDVGWYAKIAASGYSVDPYAIDGQSTVFFPLYPLLAAPLIHFLSLDPLLALHIVQKTSLLLMVYLLYRWCRAEKLVPDTALLSLVLHPAWVFLLVPYGETVYLSCLFFLLIAWQKKHAGMFFAGALLLGLSRPTGLFLLPAAGLTMVPLILEGLQTVRRGQSKLRKILDLGALQRLVSDKVFTTHMRVLCFGILGSLTAILVVALVMHLSVGDWFAFYSYRSMWKEDPGFHNFLPVVKLTFGSNFPRLFVVWFALWGCFLLFRSRRIFEGSLCAVSILLPLYQSKMGDMVRYSLCAAPAWIMFARSLESRRGVQLLFFGISAMFGVFFCVRWLARGWVG